MELQDLRPRQTWTEKNVHQGDIFVYVWNVDMISLRQKYNYTEYEAEKR
jgi:hypothetical protein